MPCNNDYCDIDQDNRSLREILDELNNIGHGLGYIQHRMIQEDISEIWRRYGGENNAEDSVQR